MIQRFCPHSHTEYSNVRLLDCINKPQDLIKRAAQIGLSGIAITDHECLGHAIKSYKIGQEIIKNYPNFKVALGNEIYLIDERKNNQKYFHFVLIAKDKQGFKQLRQLSSRAWMQSYWDRGMERVPTLKSELKEIIMREPGHLLATSACLGGELSSSVLEMEKARHVGDEATATIKYNQIVEYMQFMDELFGDDFYIEVAPAASKDQIIANNKLIQIAHVFNKKVVIGDDAHYLKKEDRYIHKAYLNSKGGERETDAFYEYAYLQDEEDLRKNLDPSVGMMIDEMCQNSMEMFDKIEIYNLLHNQTIPSVPIPDIEKPNCSIGLEDWPILNEMQFSNDKIERYWVDQCLEKLDELNLYNKNYLDELEEEARVKRIIGEKLGTNMFKYPITLKYYIDMMWECGSLVGAGRGSSCAALNHYLLGITQLDPIEWNLPFFRYMNDERT